MFEQPPLENWCIVYPEKEHYIYTKFRDTLKESFQTFNWPNKEPFVIAVPAGDNTDDPLTVWKTWEQYLS